MGLQFQNEGFSIMKQIVLFLSLLTICLESLPSSGPNSQLRRRSKEYFQPNPTEPFSRANSFQMPVVSATTTDEASTQEWLQRDDEPPKAQTTLRKTQSAILKNMITAINMQQARTPAQTPVDDQDTPQGRLHQRHHHRHDTDDAPRPEPQRKVGLCGLKTGAVFTAFMLIAGFGWTSYENWLLNGAVGDLTRTTTQLLGTVDATVSQVTTQLGSVTSQLGTLDQKVSDLATTVGTLAQTIPTTVGSLQTTVVQANTLATSQIADLTQQSRELSANLGNITGALNGLQQIIPSALTPAQEQIASLGSQLTAINGTIGGLQQLVNPLTMITPSLLEQIQTIGSNLDGIKSQITTLQTLVSGGLPTLPVTLPAITLPVELPTLPPVTIPPIDLPRP